MNVSKLNSYKTRKYKKIASVSFGNLEKFAIHDNSSN